MIAKRKEQAPPFLDEIIGINKIRKNKIKDANSIANFVNLN